MLKGLPPPSLHANITLTQPGGYSVMGFASMFGLARCIIAESDTPSFLNPGQWLLDKAPHSWTRDWGLEDDVIAPAPIIFKDTSAKGIAICAHFTDKTTLYGWETSKGIFWFPFALHCPKNPHLSLVPTLEALVNWIQHLPNLSNQQDTIDPGILYRPYLSIGRAPTSEQKSDIDSILAHCCDMLTNKLTQSQKSLVTLTLHGKSINTLQRSTPLTLRINGVEEHLLTGISPTIQTLTSLLNAKPEILGLNAQTVHYTTMMGTHQQGGILGQASPNTPLPSAHRRILIEEIIG